jgi:hypothetical protein
VAPVTKLDDFSSYMSGARRQTHPGGSRAVGPIGVGHVTAASFLWDTTLEGAWFSGPPESSLCPTGAARHQQARRMIGLEQVGLR